MDGTNPPTEDAIESFADTLQGPVLQPGDDGYGEARSTWNTIDEGYPSLVAGCTGAADVMAAVDFAREHGLPLSVKGGGHDYAVNAVGDDGLLIDLSAMDAVRVDPEGRTVRVGPGATWADVDQETQVFGLATTGATVSTVGVSGYTLSGGTGHLSRSIGHAVDNLRSADVVTATGDLVHASEDDNEDLFWAIRGGGGNFGIVTSFEFDLAEVGPEVFGGQIMFEFDDAPAVLEVYRDFMADAPDEVQVYAFIVPIPPLEAFPEELHGATSLDLVVAYMGDPEAGAEVVAPLREFGDPILDTVRPQPYTELQQTFDEGVPPGHRWYSKARYLAELSDGAIDTIVEHADPLPAPFTMVYLEPCGGAVNRVAADETAFAHRNAAYSFHMLPGWSDPEKDDEVIAWTRAFHEAMGDHAMGGVYPNLLGHDEADRVPEAYGANHERLRELKARWDPDNLFSNNHNVEPGA